MTIEYSNDENDFLTHQLFIASKSLRIQKKRRNNRIIVPICYALIGLIWCYLYSNYLITIPFFVIAILWFFLYPIWDKLRYVKHYKNFIKDNYKNRTNKSVTLELNNEYLLAKDTSGESKIFTTEIEEICDIPTTVFIRFKNGHSLILPKCKIANFDIVKNRLLDLANFLSIQYDINEKWEWK